VLLLVGWVVTVGYGAEPSEVDRLRAENAQLRDRVTALEAQLAGSRKSAASLAAAIADRGASAVHEARDAGGRHLRTDAMLVRTDSGVRNRHWVTLRAERAADTTGAPSEVELVLDAASSDGAYRTADTLQLSIDGEIAKLPVASYGTRNLAPSRGAGAPRQRDERLIVAVPLATLDRISRARRVTTEIGATTFRFTPEQLAAARVFRARLGD
jgi:hypothetical protein